MGRQLLGVLAKLRTEGTFSKPRLLQYPQEQQAPVSTRLNSKVYNHSTTGQSYTTHGS